VKNAVLTRVSIFFETQIGINQEAAKIRPQKAPRQVPVLFLLLKLNGLSDFPAVSKLVENYAADTHVQ